MLTGGTRREQTCTCSTRTANSLSTAGASATWSRRAGYAGAKRTPSWTDARRRSSRRLAETTEKGESRSCLSACASGSRRRIPAGSSNPRGGHEDIALYYRREVRALREASPTNAHVRDFVEVEWLADLAVMLGERRALETFEEAMADPDFHVRGHARCVELVERCAAAVSGMIDPYLAGRQRDAWGPTPVENPGMLHPSEMWLWVMREDFRSFGLDLRDKSRCYPRRASSTRWTGWARSSSGARAVGGPRPDSTRAKIERGAAGAHRISVRRLPRARLPDPRGGHGLSRDADGDARAQPASPPPEVCVPSVGGLGFRGAGSTVTHDYYDPMNSSLFCVLHTRVGIPITLSIVMASVAARAGLEMEFINTPGHFRCGVRDENYVDPRKPGTNPRNVVFTSDPFDEGLDATDPRKLWTIDWHRLEEDAGISADKLLPSARDVVMRMMNNLFLIYHNHEANSDDPDLETYPTDEEHDRIRQNRTRPTLPPHRWLVRHAVIALAKLLVSPGPHAALLQQESARLKQWLPRYGIDLYYHRLFM